MSKIAANSSSSDGPYITSKGRQQSGVESWDEDAYYWAADETVAACAGTGLSVTFQQVSWCTEVFVVKDSKT